MTMSQWDPRIKAGMSVEDVSAILPKILPDVRTTVARLNNLPQTAPPN
jgi:hypothetical protein